MTAQEKVEDVPVDLSPTGKFSFLHSFAVIAHPNGGFVINQLMTGKPTYSRAFSGLNDLSDFLITEKEAFLLMEDPS